MRDFISISGRGTVKEHPMFCGSPKQVADQMEEWFTAPACDGFVLAASSMPGAYDDVVRLLVPELQRRGLFRKEYAGPTLRENLGLPIPLAADWHGYRVITAAPPSSGGIGLIQMLKMKADLCAELSRLNRNVNENDASLLVCDRCRHLESTGGHAE